MRFRSASSGGKGKAQLSGRSLRQRFTASNANHVDPVTRGLTVCFTGHRQIEEDRLPALIERLDGVLLALACRGYRYFISGAALGFDTLAAERVLELRKTHPEVRLILAIPCSNQTARWSEEQCARYERMVYSADETHVLSPGYYRGCMQARNRFMVNRAAFCVCYLEQMKGGTLSTVAYALQENLPVLNVAMPGTCAAFMKGK